MDSRVIHTCISHVDSCGFLGTLTGDPELDSSWISTSRLTAAGLSSGFLVTSSGLSVDAIEIAPNIW